MRRAGLPSKNLLAMGTEVATPMVVKVCPSNPSVSVNGLICNAGIKRHVCIEKTQGTERGRYKMAVLSPDSSNLYNGIILSGLSLLSSRRHFVDNRLKKLKVNLEN